MSRITITITLPLPPKGLSPNARCHWAAKASKVKKYREDAYLACRAAMIDEPGRWERATVQATFYVRARRRRDGDNALASLKAGFDGLVDAGLLVDDEHLTHLPVAFEVDRANPRVELFVGMIEPSPRCEGANGGPNDE